MLIVRLWMTLLLQAKPSCRLHEVVISAAFEDLEEEESSTSRDLHIFPSSARARACFSFSDDQLSRLCGVLCPVRRHTARSSKPESFKIPTLVARRQWFVYLRERRAASLIRGKMSPRTVWPRGAFINHVGLLSGWFPLSHAGRDARRLDVVWQEASWVLPPDAVLAGDRSFRIRGLWYHLGSSWPGNLRKTCVFLSFRICLENDVWLPNGGLDFFATQSKMNRQMKPTALSQLHWVTDVQNIVKIASDLLQVVSCDGFLVLHGSLLSARFRLLQYTIEDVVGTLKFRLTKNVASRLAAVGGHSGRLTSGSRPGQAVPRPFCQRRKDEEKLRPKFTKCEKINIFEHGLPPTCCHGKTKMGGKLCLVFIVLQCHL